VLRCVAVCRGVLQRCNMLQHVAVHLTRSLYSELQSMLQRVAAQRVAAQRVSAQRVAAQRV